MSREEETREWRRRIRLAPPEHRLRTLGFPQPLRIPLRELTPRPEQRAAYEALTGYARWFPRAGHWTSGKGLALIGKPGTGKTTLACSLAAELTHYGGESRGPSTPGYACAFTTLEDYIRDQRRMMSISTMGKGDDPIATDLRDEYYEIFSRERMYRHQVYLLVLDDVGREYRTASGWAAQEFDSLLRARYNQGLPTALTSNIPYSAWAGEYSDSMRSFAQDACQLVEL